MNHRTLLHASADAAVTQFDLLEIADAPLGLPLRDPDRRIGADLEHQDDGVHRTRCYAGTAGADL